MTSRIEIGSIQMARRGAEIVEATSAGPEPDHFDFVAVAARVHEDGREEVLERVTGTPMEWAYGAREKLEQRYGVDDL